MNIKPCPVCDHSPDKGFRVIFCRNCGFDAKPEHWERIYGKRDMSEAYEAGYIQCSSERVGDDDQ